LTLAQQATSHCQKAHTTQNGSRVQIQGTSLSQGNAQRSSIQQNCPTNLTQLVGGQLPVYRKKKIGHFRLHSDGLDDNNLQTTLCLEHKQQNESPSDGHLHA